MTHSIRSIELRIALSLTECAIYTQAIGSEVFDSEVAQTRGARRGHGEEFKP